MDYISLFRNIEEIKVRTEKEFTEKYNLIKIPAPLISEISEGIDTDTTGGGRSISFDARETRKIYKVFQSAAKWKRAALTNYNIPTANGIITDTKTVRRDAKISNTSSMVWDELTYEFAANDAERNVERVILRLKEQYAIIKYIIGKYNEISLPEDINVFTPEMLEEIMPKLSPKQREEKIAEEQGAFILVGLGHKLDSGIKHSRRPYDTEDWNLNGEVILWHEESRTAMAIGAAAFSVDKTILKEQASLAKESIEFKYHKMILDGTLDNTFGGSIFMSRLMMIAFSKGHIGEVQVSSWIQKTNDLL